jgi:hypothetical protein
MACAAIVAKAALRVYSVSKAGGCFLTEQQKISHILATVDLKIEAEEQRKAALQVLFKSMLHQLMTGRLPVKEMEL